MPKVAPMSKLSNDELIAQKGPLLNIPAITQLELPVTDAMSMIDGIDTSHRVL